MVHAPESMVSIDEERTLAEQALKAIGVLSVLPQSRIAQDTVEILRQACRVAASADTTFSGHRGRALNRARGEVGIALPALIRAVEGTLTPDIIENARCAVGQWKAKLEEPERRPRR